MNEELLIEINAILVNISLTLDAERSTVFLLDEEKEKLVSLVSQGIENDLISMPKFEGIAGAVVQAGKSIILNDVQEDKRFNELFDRITGFQTKKILCAPIKDEYNNIIGVIQSLNKIDKDFDARDLTILETFSDAISLVVKNANRYASTEAMKNEIATLLKVSSSINSELDLSNLIKLIIKQATEITQSDRSSFFLLDKEENILWTKFGEGLGSKIIKTRKGLASLVAKTKQPIIENNPYDNPHFDQSVDAKMNYRTKSIISIPVFDGIGNLIGVIQSINKKKGDFTNKDLFILNGFAAHISIAIQNSTLFEEISTIKNYLNILFENLDNGILTIDKEGIIKTVNTRFCEILGVQQNDIIGRHYQEMNNDYFSFLEYSNFTFSSGEKFEKQNLEYLNAKEQKVIFHFSVLPMKNQNGDNIGVINVIQDVTDEQRVRENLNRYLPQHVINEIIHKADLSLFNGKYKKCSILFSDIRNFTSIAEQMKPRDVVRFLNNYFDVMVETVLEYQGVLDKLIGDAIMATFGIPYNTQEDASNAVEAALSMIDRLNIVNDKKEIDQPIKIGIGIATGNVISGNIGSKKRFDYTVIGDSVNLASRLESLTKVYGQAILICESTFSSIQEEFNCREIDCIMVKGRQQPVSIYTIINRKNQPTSKRENLFSELYQNGLNAYREQSFNQAIVLFNRALLLNAKDRPARLLRSRCEQFIINPPEKYWNGIWAFSQK